MRNKVKKFAGALAFRVNSKTIDNIQQLKGITGYESETDFCRDVFMRGLGDLSQEISEFVPDIVVIGSKIDKNVDLTHAEISYLSRQAHRAYQSSVEIDYYNPFYILDNLLVAQEVSKLIKIDPATIKKIQFEVIGHDLTIREFIDENIAKVDNDGKIDASMATKLLFILTHDKSFKDINIKKLNKAINEYLPTLLIVSKFTCYQENGKEPLFHFDDYNQYIEQNAIKAEGIGLHNDSISVNNEHFRVDFTLSPRMPFSVVHKQQKWIFRVPFDKFIGLKTVLHDIPEEGFGSFMFQGINLLVCNGEASKFYLCIDNHSYLLNVDELAELATILHDFSEQQPKLIQANAMQWGAI